MSTETERNKLEVLEDLFESLDIEGPDEDQMYQLYGIFIRDMIKCPIFIGKIQVGYRKEKSKHPLFKGKPEGFEHICTRESKYSKQRVFDPERANKIHWIKPIVENDNNVKIKYFERLHYNGQNQRYFWYQDKNYVVIVREITEKLQLITAFKVDDIEKNRFLQWYKAYQET